MPYKDHNKQKEFQKLWVRKRRADHFKSKGSKCAKCGDHISSHSGQLDHKKPHYNTEKIDHRLWSLKKSKRSKKLKGMQLLCKFCHKEKTAKDIAKMHENLENINLLMAEDWLPEDLLEEYKDSSREDVDYCLELEESYVEEQRRIHLQSYVKEINEVLSNLVKNSQEIEE